MTSRKMPHNNRVSASVALKTNSIWTKTIGYDPYAAKDENHDAEVKIASEQAAGLLMLAKMSNLSGDTRGACGRCGMAGHLTFQCRNSVIVHDEDTSDSSSSSSEEDIPQKRIRSPSVESVDAVHNENYQLSKKRSKKDDSAKYLSDSKRSTKDRHGYGGGDGDRDRERERESDREDDRAKVKKSKKVKKKKSKSSSKSKKKKHSKASH